MNKKPSKIPGVKLIPNHWVESKWRYITNVLTDYTANGSFGDLAKNVRYLSEPDYARLIRLTDLRVDLKNEGLFVDKASYDYLKKSSLHGGEFLIANVGAYAGLMLRMPRIDYKATLGPNMMLAKFNKTKVTEDYMMFIANSDYIKNQLFIRATSSSAQPKLNKEDFRNIEFLLPPLNEQEIIANFLHKNLPLIDKNIKNLNNKISLLNEFRQSIITEAVTKGLNPNVKMKDSGVEWIGEIPQEWSVILLKRVLEYLTDYEANGSFSDVKANVSLDNDDKFAWYVRATDLENNRVGIVDDNRTCDEKTYKFLTKTALYGGEILVAKRGEIGKCYIMPEGPFNATLAPNLYLLRTTKECSSKYLYYWFKSFLGKSELILANKSTTIGALYKDDIKESLMILPSSQEQKKIIKFLDNKEKQFDLLIDKIENQINILKNTDNP